jgi:glutamate dehydrogenase (NADP+)
MTDRARELTDTFMADLRDRYGHEPEFLQAVEEVALDVITVEKANAEYARARILSRLSEPDRIISFRVTWPDDKGEVRINRCWRVQHCNAIGPYKGGLRFAPTVTRSVLKFLAFEQTFKNSLTGLMLGGAKGGSDFDPSGKTDAELQRFAQGFMAELQHHIGPMRDIPAGDIGVGAREIGYMFAAWKRYTLDFAGVITGKSQCIGGSALRREATGYGAVYFLCAMLGASRRRDRGQARRDLGDGQCRPPRRAQGAGAGRAGDRAERFVGHDGGAGRVLGRGARLAHRAQGRGAQHQEPAPRVGPRLASGRQALEPRRRDRHALRHAERDRREGGARASRRRLPDDRRGGEHAVDRRGGADRARGRHRACAGEAANAGGVAVSGFEMGQNAVFQPLAQSEIDRALGEVMRRVHDRLLDEARGLGPTEGGVIDYPRAANVAAYRRVADALLDHGIV